MAAHLFPLRLFQGSTSLRRNNSLQLKSVTPEKSNPFTRPCSQALNTTCEAIAQKTALHKGVLVEFKKDSGRIVLGVAQNREEKRNWNVIDQVGLQNLIELHSQRNVGDEFFVRVVESQPRKSYLHLKEM